MLQALALSRSGRMQLAWLAVRGQAPPNPEAFLHPAEIERARRLASSTRREHYVLGRYVAKEAVVATCSGLAPEDLWIESGVFGQPIVRSPLPHPPAVSISHSGRWTGALAFDARHPMGIDLEIVSDRNTSALIATVSPAEQRILATLPLSETEKAALLWTAKESVSKVLMTGLTASLEFYEVSSITPQNGLLVLEFAHLPQYKAVTFSCEGVQCSIALPRQTEWLTSTDALRQLIAPARASTR